MINAKRLLLASIHSYLGPSRGAAMASRELLELLTARGWDCRVLACGVLDYQRETPLDEALARRCFKISGNLLTHQTGAHSLEE